MPALAPDLPDKRIGLARGRDARGCQAIIAYAPVIYHGYPADAWTRDTMWSTADYLVNNYGLVIFIHDG